MHVHVDVNYFYLYNKKKNLCDLNFSNYLYCVFISLSIKKKYKKID